MKPKIPLLKDDLFRSLAMPRGTVKLRAYVWLQKDERVKARFAFVDREGEESDALVLRCGPQLWRMVLLPAVQFYCTNKLLSFDLREFHPQSVTDAVPPIT